jgi:hypothetical protein
LRTLDTEALEDAELTDTFEKPESPQLFLYPIIMKKNIITKKRKKRKAVLDCRT